MATLKQTLGTSPNTQVYKYPALPSPYPTYRSYSGPSNLGANINFPAQPNVGTPGGYQPPPPLPGNKFYADYNFDPVLARIQAMSSMTNANAQAEASSLKKQTLIDAGDVDIAREYGVDAPTLEATRQNTEVAKLSTLARLNRDAQERARQLDESTNVQNLFYSGKRAEELGNQAQGMLEARNDFGRSLRAALAQIESGRLEAEARARAQDLQARLDAAGRLAGVGVAPGAGAGGGGGGGGGQGPPPQSPATPPPPPPALPPEMTPPTYDPNAGWGWPVAPTPPPSPADDIATGDFGTMDQPLFAPFVTPDYLVDPFGGALAQALVQPDPFLRRWGI